jgi:lipoyl(octanoyl) transferase
MPSGYQDLPLIIRHLGLQDYAVTFAAMREFIEHRDVHCNDEVWFLQHKPVFTQGQAGKSDYILSPGDIPIIKSDRGGQLQVGRLWVIVPRRLFGAVTMLLG